MGPDMMVIPLIVLLLFGAKNCLKSPEVWVGRSGGARDEVERELG